MVERIRIQCTNVKDFKVTAAGGNNKAFASSAAKCASFVLLASVMEMLKCCFHVISALSGVVVMP